MPEIQTNTPARQYETIYVLRPDAGRETSESISTKIQDVFSSQRGALTRVENWGYRKLAYTVRKQTRGVYVYLQYVGDGELVNELERNLRLQDAVLKYQTVKISDSAPGESAGTVEFEHLDVPEEEEPEESFAKSLGLEDDSRGDSDHGSRDSGDDGDESDDASDDSSDDDDNDKEDS